MRRRRSSETKISRPAAEQDHELPVNTSPGADGNYDPARAGATSPTGPTTTIAFNEYEFDFGTLTQGDAVTYMFEFTNSVMSRSSLTIAKARGCTVPKCPKEPIYLAKGQIEVKFNSKGENQQTKKVTINAIDPLKRS